MGLKVGADDYVIKPFSPRELVARVKAILRRTQGPTGPSARRVGELEVDEDRHHVAVGGTPVELTAKEFGLLRTLMRAHGRVLNWEQLPISHLNEIFILTSPLFTLILLASCYALGNQ